MQINMQQTNRANNMVKRKNIFLHKRITITNKMPKDEYILHKFIAMTFKCYHSICGELLMISLIKYNKI